MLLQEKKWVCWRKCCGLYFKKSGFLRGRLIRTDDILLLRNEIGNVICSCMLW